MLVSLQKRVNHDLILQKGHSFSAWNDTKAKETDEFWDITQS